MSAKKELDALAAHKELLILEGELHRSVIQLECAALQRRFTMLKTAQSQIAASGPWWAAGSAVAGLLAIRHWRKLLHWAPTLVTAARWLRKFRST